jgi:drug/metabolite transporter (DMT)-like permease
VLRSAGVGLGALVPPGAGDTLSVTVVAPFALIAPCAGALSSALIFDEVFGPMRYAGMALILSGLAVIVLPSRTPHGVDRIARAWQGEDTP